VMPLVVVVVVPTNPFCWDATTKAA
jgi:hypothetical protein